ncbi:MAG: transposase [Candidatus Poribacteria bacterium]
MKYDPNEHHRRSIRLKDYDYSQSGAYFVTICTYKKQCLFGGIINGKAELTEIGMIAERCWRDISNHFQNVSLDYFVIMPNHIHGIINIVGAKHSHLASMNKVNALPANALPLRLHGTNSDSLGAIIQNFKSITTRKINKMLKHQGVSIWQKNYYEHVIRNDDNLNEIREYIINNPLKWALDSENIAPPEL